VVTSVKPIHSLVSGVMEGIGRPDLIVKGSASPHTYSLRPSQARQLEDADLVFWMGHELESFLEQPLEAIATKAHIVELIDSSKLKKIQMREGGMFDAHAHDDHDEHEGHDDHDEHEGHDDQDMMTTMSTKDMMTTMSTKDMMTTMSTKDMMTTMSTKDMMTTMSTKDMMIMDMVSLMSTFGLIQKMPKFWLMKSS